MSTSIEPELTAGVRSYTVEFQVSVAVQSLYQSIHEAVLALVSKALVYESTLGVNCAWAEFRKPASAKVAAASPHFKVRLVFIIIGFLGLVFLYFIGVVVLRFGWLLIYIGYSLTFTLAPEASSPHFCGVL